MTRALALRAIRARPLRSLLNGIAVALGIAVVLGVAITVSGLGDESRAAVAAAAGGSGLDARVSVANGLTAEDAALLGTLPGVTDEAPLYQKRVIARVLDQNVSGSTVDVVAERGGAVALRPLALSSGRLPRSTSHAEVVLDTGLAATLAAAEHRAPLQLGDAIQLTTNTGPDRFIIVGFSNGGAGGAAFTRSAVYVTETSMLTQFRLGLRTAMVALQLAPDVASATVADEVHNRLQSVNTVDPRAVSSTPLQEVQPLLLLITVLSLMIGAGATANSVALAASERRRETALLRAAGASERQVSKLFLFEVLMVAAAAAPFGIAAGVGLAAVLEARLTPPDLPAPGLSVSLLQIALATLIGAGSALIGAAIVAVRTDQRVLANLRPHPGSERERIAALPLVLAPPALLAGGLLFILGDGTGVAVGAVLVLLGVLAALPLLAPVLARSLGRLANLLTPLGNSAAANLVRRRNRTALTLSGLTISVASAVAVSALAIGSISGGDQWISHLFAGDVVVRSPVTQTDAVQQAIAASPGVRAVLPLRFLAAPSGSSMMSFTAVNAAAYGSGSTLQMVSATRADAVRTISNGAAVLAPEQLAARQGWQVGSTVLVSTLHGDVSFLVGGIVQHSFPSGTGGETLIIDQRQAERYFGSTATGFDNLDVITDGNRSGVDATAAQFGLSAVTVDDIRASAQRAVEHALGLLLAVAIIALVMSMVAVVNTLLVNIRQGTRELSMLRAVGLGSTAARRLVLTEAALLAACGAVLGVATGCVLVLGMLRAVATPGFAPPFTFPTMAAIAIVAAVVGGTLIATLVPALRVSRTSIVAAIRQD